MNSFTMVEENFEFQRSEMLHCEIFLKLLLKNGSVGYWNLSSIFYKKGLFPVYFPVFELVPVFPVYSSIFKYRWPPCHTNLLRQIQHRRSKGLESFFKTPSFTHSAHGNLFRQIQHRRSKEEDFNHYSRHHHPPPLPMGV